MVVTYFGGVTCKRTHTPTPWERYIPFGGVVARCIEQCGPWLRPDEPLGAVTIALSSLILSHDNVRVSRIDNLVCVIFRYNLPRSDLLQQRKRHSLSCRWKRRNQRVIIQLKYFIRWVLVSFVTLSWELVSVAVIFVLDRADLGSVPVRLKSCNAI